jgi:hypothetical protein
VAFQIPVAQAAQFAVQASAGDVPQIRNTSPFW